MGNGPHSQMVTGLATNELTTPSVKRVGLHSPFFARRTIFFATDVAMGASRSAIFNRFKASPEVPHDAPQHLGNPRRLTRALGRDSIPPTPARYGAYLC